MIARLAVRNLAYRPWRSVLLLVGYALGVGVMIVLLAIGEALLTQARDEKLVGGGAITVLPAGLDVEVMKTGGVGGLFFSIDRARFVYRQLLASPRYADVISAVAPQIDGKLLYLRTARGELAVRATGEVPSRTAAVGAAPALASGTWADDDGDRRWVSPTPAELYHQIDRFHLPPPDVAHRESWGEWHYFNVLSHDRRRWAFITLLLAGDVPAGRWGGQVLVSVREQDGRTRRFVATHPPERIRFSTEDADLALGDSHVTLTADARYVVRVRAREEGGRATLAADLVVTPAPRAYFPDTELAGGPIGGPRSGQAGENEFASGYAVPALRADAEGTICVAGECERFDGAQAYHDHNWGVWRGVTWEWGAARAGAYTLLYGRVHAPGGASSAPPLFLYLVDSLGALAVFRPARVEYEDARTISVNGRTVRVPARALLADARGADTLTVTLEIQDAIGTDTRLPLIERGDVSAARALAAPYFIQMKGTARLSGRVQGVRVAGEGTGFFETYR